MKIKAKLTPLIALMSSLAKAGDVPGICPCPDNETPEAVLRCVLDKPADGSLKGLQHCLVNPGNGYPPYHYNPRRPNVYRSYKILSVSDGKPFKGQDTKRIRVEFDYVAKLSERHPEGEHMCKRWLATIIAYHTEQGWIVSQPGDGDQFWKLQPLLEADLRRLDQDYSQKHILGIKELSTRIDSLGNASNYCPMPPKGDRK